MSKERRTLPEPPEANLTLQGFINSIIPQDLTPSQIRNLANAPKTTEEDWNDYVKNGGCIRITLSVDTILKDAKQVLEQLVLNKEEFIGLMNEARERNLTDNERQRIKITEHQEEILANTQRAILCLAWLQAFIPPGKRVIGIRAGTRVVEFDLERHDLPYVCLQMAINLFKA